MQLTVIGTGYVGLVTAACFADTGNDVVGYDIDKAKIELLRVGSPPIFEPGLSDMLRANLAAGRLRFTHDLAEAVRHGKIIFITIGTPSREDGSADLTAVKETVEQIAALINEPKTVVVKSTVPVGTCDMLQERLTEISKWPVRVVSNPEFLKEGSAVDDFLRPDRVIIGTDDPDAAAMLRRLYLPFVRNQKPILVMSRRAAEMSKYAANAYLAMRVSFINEIANICEKLDVDINEVRLGIGSDSRIGHHFLYPGPGYGGSCFPKDVQALMHIARSSGIEPQIIQAVHEVNERQKRLLFEKVSARFNGNLRGLRFAVWGVTFKPKTDDIRESPAIVLIDLLLKAGASVVVHDPQGLKNLEKLYGNRIEYREDEYEPLTGADALVIVTEWNEFRTPNFERMKSLMKRPIIFDGRNLYDLDQVEQAGFEYYSIGRRAVRPQG